MKLNPPASSSDLEAAREIARRLHQRRRRADLGRGEDAAAPIEPAVPPSARPSFRAPAPARPPAVPRPVTPPVATPPAAVESPASADLSLAGEPAPPSWDEAEAEDATTAEDHVTGALGDLTGDAVLDDDDAIAEASRADVTTPSPVIDVEEDPLAGAAPPDLPGIDVEEETVSPDEMVGSAEDEVVVTTDLEDGADAGLFEEPLADGGLGDPEVAEAAEPAALGSTEELFDEPPPPPSWDDVVETCRDLAGATGSMIIDPAGQVFAAHGEWPEPGPDAIAARLVAMMDRTLKDAPTRSVSAPVGGQHLTAWRVPLAEGLVTAAFIAHQPLRSEVRSAIDAEIHRGAGA